MAESGTLLVSYLESCFSKVLALVRPHLDAESIRALAAEAAARSAQYARDHARDHPYSTAFAILNVGLMPILGAGWLTGSLLKFVGFGPSGPIAGTAATWYQSTWLGAYIPADSFFAFLQKWAMTL